MTLDELLETIELDSPQQLEYFEQLAALLEIEQDIPFEVFYSALSKVNAETIGELTENYFDELSKILPDDSDDIASLLETISQQLLNLAENVDNEDGRRAFIDELFKFREWYHTPNLVDTADDSFTPLEAITEIRADKLDNIEKSYDFTKAYEAYELDELTMLI